MDPDPYSEYESGYATLLLTISSQGARSEVGSEEPNSSPTGRIRNPFKCYDLYLNAILTFASV
jgi:hypothetical protein